MTPDDLEKIKDLGWALDIVMQIAEQFVTQEAEEDSVYRATEDYQDHLQAINEVKDFLNALEKKVKSN